MKRYPAYDPPEYQAWHADTQVMEEFRKTVSERAATLSDLRSEDHVRLYKGMLRNRLHDIALKRWVRQGVISKAWLGTGEEATTVGAVHALAPGDVVGPMIRNAGACHERGMSLADMLRGYLGTPDSPTGGRDLHIGDLSLGILSPISMVGSLLPVCAGAALGFKVKKQSSVALTWVGDGSTRTTAFHEGMTTARSLGLPLIVIVQNNQIALGTLLASHSRAPMEKVAAIYGLTGSRCDGNNVLDVYAATLEAARSCRRGEGPVVLTANTFRMGGHATHDEGESRDILPPELFEHWGKRDPIGMYEAYLVEPEPGASPLVSRELLERAEADVIGEIETAATEALASRE